jgi:hypothetical protein
MLLAFPLTPDLICYSSCYENVPGTSLEFSWWKKEGDTVGHLSLRLINPWSSSKKLKFVIA